MSREIAIAASLAPVPPQRAAIFESYGWADAGEIVQRLKASLEEAG